MQIQTLLLATMAALPVLSAPATEVSMLAAATPQWTIKSFVRTCNAANTSCKYSYSIFFFNVSATTLIYTITGATASRASYNNKVCGPYTISSNWSGQFGAGNGFQTLAVVDQKAKRIVYPAYTDKQLVSGKVVSPDQSYPVQNLP